MSKLDPMRDPFYAQLMYVIEKVKKPVSHADWNRAISAVEASLKVRRSTEPGSRSYLDYVRTFIGEGRV